MIFLQAMSMVGRPVARRLDDGLTEILRGCTKQKGSKIYVVCCILELEIVEINGR